MLHLSNMCLLPDAVEDQRRPKKRGRDILIRNQSRLLAVAFAIGALTACDGNETPAVRDTGMSCGDVQAPQGPCANGWDLYQSTTCSPPDINNGPSCTSQGDDRCYEECTTDSDCHDPCFPRCLSLPFGDGTDLVTYRSLCRPAP